MSHKLCEQCKENYTQNKQYKLCNNCYEIKNPKPILEDYQIPLTTTLGTFYYNIEATCQQEATDMAEAELKEHLCSKNCGWLELKLK